MVRILSDRNFEKTFADRCDSDIPARNILS